MRMQVMDETSISFYLRGSQDGLLLLCNLDGFLVKTFSGSFRCCQQIFGLSDFPALLMKQWLSHSVLRNYFFSLACHLLLPVPNLVYVEPSIPFIFRIRNVTRSGSQLFLRLSNYYQHYQFKIYRMLSLHPNWLLSNFMNQIGQSLLPFCQFYG